MSGDHSVITIGNFDGVHVGHRALVRRAVELARTVGGRVVIMAFDPHPLTRLRPDAAPPRLTGFDRRSELLRAAGADEIVRLEPRDEVLRLSPEEFLRTLVLPRNPTWVVEGSDFHFGRGRAGNVRVLAQLARELGFDAEIVAPVEVALGDHQVVTASSTIVRWLLANGRVSDAARVLGRPYEVRGTVVKGDQRGRLLGFPTANLDTDLLLPADGVYAGVARLEDGRVFDAAINVGTRPTFDGVARRLEAHLLGPRPDELPEYGWPLTVEVTSFIRDDLRFDSVDRLKDQIARDCRVARVLLEDRRAIGTAAAVGGGGVGVLT